MPQELVILLIQVLLKYGPAAVIAIREILSKETVTDADWDKLIAVVSKPYDSYLK